MNPDPLAGVDEDLVFQRAAELQPQIVRRKLDDAVLHHGFHDSGKLLEDETLQDATAREALQRALAEQLRPPTLKGPSRRRKPKAGAKKRQRQARKANRAR